MRRTDAVLAAGVMMAASLAVAVLAAMGSLEGFLSWAWERHHNVLSWYVRPLFVLPLAYFSYRSSLAVINAVAVTKVAWGVVDGAGSGWVMLGPALAGLAVCDAAVLYAIGRLGAGPYGTGRGGEPTPR